MKSIVTRNESSVKGEILPGSRLIFWSRLRHADKTFLNSRRTHSTLHRCNSGPCLWYLVVLASSLPALFLKKRYFLFFIVSTAGSLLTYSFCYMLRLFFSKKRKAVLSLLSFGEMAKKRRWVLSRAPVSTGQWQLVCQSETSAA